MTDPRALAVPLVAGVGYLPERASSVAGGVDRVFGLLFWTSAFFLALIVVLTVVFVVRYRRRPSRPDPEPSPSHSTRLELFWSAIRSPSCSRSSPSRPGPGRR